jgi:hypothetical protein
MVSADTVVSRRKAMRLFAGGSLALSAIALEYGSAIAARGWCLADPVLRIGEQSAHVYISSLSAMLSSATDKIILQVTLPVGIKGQLETINADFGKGYRVRFFESSNLVATRSHVPVQLAVYCPARNTALPVNVDFTPVGDGRLTAASTAGTADRWIYLVTG